MILTGSAIRSAVERERIVIDPFDESALTPNSYDFRLGATLLTYRNAVLDCRRNEETETLLIPTSGMILEPHRLYLGHSVERIGSDFYVPILRGRSSTGRLGLFVHITADLIDIGSCGQFTLQLHAVQRVRVYPGMKIGQVTFWVPQGAITLYSGKYQGSSGPQSSQSFKDFNVSDQ